MPPFAASPSSSSLSKTGASRASTFCARSRCDRSACVSASPSLYASRLSLSSPFAARFAASRANALRPAAAASTSTSSSSIPTPCVDIAFLCFLESRCCCRDFSERQSTPGHTEHFTAMPLDGSVCFFGAGSSMGSSILCVNAVGVSSDSSFDSSEASPSLSLSSSPLSFPLCSFFSPSEFDSSPDVSPELVPSEPEPLPSAPSLSSAPLPSLSTSESLSSLLECPSSRLNNRQSRRLNIANCLGLFTSNARGVTHGSSVPLFARVDTTSGAARCGKTGASATRRRRR